MGLIARSLNLREHEGGRVALVLLFSFVIGLSRIFLLPAQALFLERYGADNLPFAYLIAAGTTVALSSAFLWLGRKLRPTQLLLVNLVVTTGITALLQLLALVSFGDWPIALLMAWYVIQYSISSLAFWAVALALFDVREGKRLFALVTSGDMLAYVIGGVLIGPTTALIGTINVVTLSALSSMVAIAMAWHFVRAYRQRFASAQPSTAAARRKFDLRLLRGPYVMLITCYFMLSGVEYIFVDNAFNVATQAYFGADDPAVLVEFFGLFAAATAVANLLFRSLLAGRLIEYFGLVTGLAALPSTILIGAGLVAATGTFWPAAGIVLFAIMTLTRLSDKVLRGVQNASLATLYQPLLQNGPKVQTLMEGVVDPIAFATAAIVLLLVNAGTKLTAVDISYLLIPICLVWIGVSLWLRRHYVHVLSGALRSRRLRSATFVMDDDARRLLLEQLHSSRPENVAYALDLIAEQDRNLWRTALLSLIDHPDEDIRLNVFGQIATAPFPEAQAPMARRLPVETSPVPRATLIRALCALSEDYVPHAIDALESGAPESRRAAMVGLIRSGSMRGMHCASRVLLELLESWNPQSRVDAASIIGEVGLAHLTPDLRRLLRDPEEAVRLAAAHAAQRISNPLLCPDLIPLVQVERTAFLASMALRSIGEPALPWLAKALENSADERAVRRVVLGTIGQIGGREAATLLLAAIPRLDLDDRDIAFLAFARAVDDRLPGLRRVVDQMIDGQLHECAFWFRCRGELGQSPGEALLARALDQELDRARLRVFQLLSILYDRAAIEQARDNYLVGSIAQQAYALELLENLLPKRVWQRIAPLFENLSLDKRLARLPAVSAAGDPALRALLAEGCVGWWTRCCALHAAALMRLDVREDVARHLSAKDRLQRHSAALAWMALAREPMSSPEQSVRRRAAALIAEGPSLGVVEMVELLRASDLFVGTREAILADVVAVLTEQTLSPGDVLCREGEPGGELYIVAGGAAQVMRQGHFLAEVGRGAIIGEFAVILGAPRTATVTATTTLHLYCLNESSLRELLVSERAIASRLVQLMISRASANRVTFQHG